MVIDTSAIVAIFLHEPEAPDFEESIAHATTRLMSAVTRVELSFVLEGRTRGPGAAEIARFLADTHIEVAAVTPQQADMAIDAFRRFGKGRHRARLNIGDCFAYALAKATGLPLLFKGGDFALTDIRSASPS
jgi:ribonuclease VapC